LNPKNVCFFHILVANSKTPPEPHQAGIIVNLTVRLL